MATKKIAKSIRIFIRNEKAKIRKEAATSEEANGKIKALLAKHYK